MELLLTRHCFHGVMISSMGVSAYQHAVKSRGCTLRCANVIVYYITIGLHNNRIYSVAYLGFHFGGGFKFFLEKWGYLHGAKRHAARGEATRLLGGFGGMLPRENF